MRIECKFNRIELEEVFLPEPFDNRPDGIELLLQILTAVGEDRDLPPELGVFICQPRHVPLEVRARRCMSEYR